MADDRDDEATDAPLSLRERRRQQTRREIINAYAELSLERGFNNFTIQDIADRVGISHRTLYRYFKNREAIVAGLEEEVARQVFDPSEDPTLDRAAALRHNYRVFGEYRKPMLVHSLMIQAEMVAAPGRDSRSDFVRRMVEEQATNLSDIGKRQLFGLLRVVAGSLAWARLTSDEIGLTDEEAGAASAWAMDALIEASRSARGDLL